jgi:hypothetical protein
VRLAAHQPLPLKAVDQVGDARRVHLEALPDLAERERPAAAEVEEHQRLVAGERQPVRSERLVQPREPDLLDAHHRGHRLHRRDVAGVEVRGPLAPRLLDRVKLEGHSRLPWLVREAFIAVGD